MPKLACCFPPCVGNACELRPTVIADVLATALGTYTADIDGEGEPFTVTQPYQPALYHACTTDPNLGYKICPYIDCCNSCTTNCSTLTCWQNEKRSVRLCNDVLGSSNRQFTLPAENARCDCLGTPNDCNICVGQTVPMPFANYGLNAYAPATFGCAAVACPSCIPLGALNQNTWNLGSKETGTAGTTTYKLVRLRSWDTVAGGQTVCHLALDARFCVRHSEPFTGTGCTGTDGFTTNLSYWRYWNGTDNAAAFLGKALYLRGVSWNYSLCPFNNQTGTSPWRCVTVDSFTPTDCGVGACPPCTDRVITYAVTDYETGRQFVKCHTDCVSSMNPIIDAYQPWTTIPATLALT